MITAKVIGSVVATQKHKILEGQKLLLVRPVGIDGNVKGKAVVAIDTVQAGPGDTVLILDEGNSARMILGSKDAPARTVIVGIVDEIGGGV